ncbi:alpha-ketoacid dehydrogenase subunit alpha/beta [Oceanibium sediminis]|uniref:alpha-ketoacid dehydrogenase subunit alpha/beta n=1 Tax=Oceanibium sediminis TaxID=2026339 RepID=UPI000DD32C0E|nr:alpha-ketoacid dehydrogenase subunit alpha/beta [Oceanibium sediminis]
MLQQIQAGTALDFYRRMRLIRGCEQIAMDLSTGSEPFVAGSVHLCAGQEAIPVGTSAALQDGDCISATYRGHGWAIESGLGVFEVLSEIAHRATGVNGGRSGSALMMAPERGFIGENSIVGAGTTIADGVAMALKQKGQSNISVVSIGDGAMNQGAVHEALVFAALRKLPVLFICENNGWAEMTPSADVSPVARQAKRLSGYGVKAATVDGKDPVTVRDSVAAARQEILRTGMPIFLEFTAPRLWGHYNKDLQHYRSKAEWDAAQADDPIELFRKRLVAEKLATNVVLDELDEIVAADLAEVEAKVRSAPEPDPATAKDHLYVASDKSPIDGQAKGEVVDTTYGKAISEALATELAARPEVLVYGEDVGGGGIFGCTRGLNKTFGDDRVFDTPISENAILGSALGASMLGMRPVVEIMWGDFVLVALDQIVNQMTNLRYLTSGRSSAPLVVRMQHGVTPGSCAQHSQSLEAMFFHVPGIRIGLPSTAQDAYDMLRSAIAHDDPVILIESRLFYQDKAQITVGGPVQPIGGLAQRREGKDVALISWSTGMPVVEKAADALAAEGIDASVIDMRWLSPLPLEELIAAVEASGRAAVIVHEANLTGGVGAELALNLREAGLDRVTRVATPDVRMPASPALQAALLPSPEGVAAAARRIIKS